MASARDLPTRILIVEDHRIVAEGLAALLNLQSDMDVVGTVGSVSESVSQTAELKPDVVILDFSLSDGTGADAATGIYSVHSDAKLIFLTRHESDAVRLAAVEAGASAFIHKSRAADEVVAAIRWVAEGGTLIGAPDIAAQFQWRRATVNHAESLTKREKDVLRLMAQGASSREIGLGLGISYNTVRSHIRSLGWKLAAQSKLETVSKARKLALID
jgi:DNA-binding NarL/FixJ family response regulator